MKKEKYEKTPRQLKKLLVETDSPFLAPTPKRGKENEPSYIIYTLRKLMRLY